MSIIAKFVCLLLVLVVVFAGLAVVMGVAMHAGSFVAMFDGVEIAGFLGGSGVGTLGECVGSTCSI